MTRVGPVRVKPDLLPFLEPPSQQEESWRTIGVTNSPEAVAFVPLRLAMFAFFSATLPVDAGYQPNASLLTKVGPAGFTVLFNRSAGYANGDYRFGCGGYSHVR